MDKNGKILIVDDSKFNREILSEILRRESSDSRENIKSIYSYRSKKRL